jgi:hypothetical protein
MPYFIVFMELACLDFKKRMYIFVRKFFLNSQVITSTKINVIRHCVQ